MVYLVALFVTAFVLPNVYCEIPTGYILDNQSVSGTATAKIVSDGTPFDKLLQNHILKRPPKIRRDLEGFAATCSSEADNNAKITVTTDLSVTIDAHCRDGDIETSLQEGQTFVEIQAYYNGSQANTCYFHVANEATDMYVLDIDVFWSPSPGIMAVQQESKRITCSMNAFAQEQKDVTGDGNLLAPADITEMKGANDQNTSITMVVQDVLEKPLANTAAPLGKMVRLFAELDAGSPLNGLVPVTCIAYSLADKSTIYKILSGGCGDGVVLERTDGFDTDGKTSSSPYFRMFEVLGSRDVSFECNFTTCADACDGSSCALSRRKRSAKPDLSEDNRGEDGYITVSTPVIQSVLPSYLTVKDTDKKRISEDTEDIHKLVLSNLTLRVYIGMSILCTLMVASLLISLYLCLKLDSLRNLISRQRPCPCPDSDRDGGKKAPC